MKRLFAFLFMFIIIINFANAIPPVLQTSNGVDGVDIEILAPITIPPNTAITVHVHTFNKSNGVLFTSADVSCEGMLVDNRGVTIVTQAATIVDDHFSFGLNDTMAPTIGNYHYTLHCNNSLLGGYHTGYFQVTDGGLELNDGIFNAFFILFSLATFLFLLWSLYKIFVDLTQLNTNFYTVFIGFSAYIVNLVYYYFALAYMPWELMIDLSFIGISAFGITHLFLPLVGLVFTWIKNGGVE